MRTRTYWVLLNENPASGVPQEKLAEVEELNVGDLSKELWEIEWHTLDVTEY